MTEENIIPFVSRSVKTMADGTLRISVDVEPGDAQDAFKLFGVPGAAGAMVRLTDAAAQSQMQQRMIDSAKPFGQQAKILYQSSFFRAPEVWAAAGSDEKFLQWLRLQKCAYTGRDGTEDDPVEAAHVRRVANGAGTGIKPQYSAIPLLHSVHVRQHQEGESAIAPREWWDEQRVKHLHGWSRFMIKNQLGYESWADVPPAELLTWAQSRGIDRHIPRGYLCQ
ncbi:hypothetical protein [Hahella ganghwensis]|uniref:hypothetical protein n=1 Tax=Hahella ganghwensis TaxID=286420 RepID=UPI0003664C22|nr:hypothetical protein [Hahella ganghwensis]